MNTVKALNRQLSHLLKDISSSNFHPLNMSLEDRKKIRTMTSKRPKHVF